MGRVAMVDIEACKISQVGTFEPPPDQGRVRANESFRGGRCALKKQ